MTVKDYDRDALVVSISDVQPGAGKLVMTLALAAVLAQCSREAMRTYQSIDAIDVCLVEVKGRSSDFMETLHVTSPTAADLARSGQKITKNSVRKHLVYNDELGFHTFLAPAQDGDAEGMTPEFYRDVVTVLREMFDVVILDTATGPREEPYLQMALQESDHTLLVASLWMVDDTREWVQKWGVDTADVLITRCDRNSWDEVKAPLAGVSFAGFFPPHVLDGALETDDRGNLMIDTSKMEYPGLFQLGSFYAEQVGRVLARPATLM
ncbi:MAG: hypothetical protein H9W81_07685 [Enterococcus sp.]|nr:hypothetical protein [Enterococcus sp.]